MGRAVIISTKFGTDVPVSPARCSREVDFPTNECPNTVQIAKTIINFPTWYNQERLSASARNRSGNMRLRMKWNEVTKRFPEANFPVSRMEKG